MLSESQYSAAGGLPYDQLLGAVVDSAGEGPLDQRGGELLGATAWRNVKGGKPFPRDHEEEAAPEVGKDLVEAVGGPRRGDDCSVPLVQELVLYLAPEAGGDAVGEEVGEVCVLKLQWTCR